MKICGIDPGNSGGLCILAPSEPPDAFPMPLNGTDVDYVKIRSQIASMGLVVIETFPPFQKASKRANWSLGRHIGILQGICIGLGIGLILVKPQDWYKVILRTTKKSAGIDKPSLPYIQNRFPGLNLLPTDRCKKPSDGMSDAVCIALYGQFIALQGNIGDQALATVSSSSV